MKKAPRKAGLRLISNNHKHTHSKSLTVPQVSRPSTLRTLDEASAAMALYRFDLNTWLASPCGLPMPLLRDYGMNLAQPSSDEMLARFGGGS